MILPLLRTAISARYSWFWMMAWHLINTKPSPNVAVKYINFPVINTHSIWVIQGIWNIINSLFNFWCRVLYFCMTTSVFVKYTASACTMLLMPLVWVTMGQRGVSHYSCSSLTWSLFVLQFGVGLVYLSPSTISVKDIPGITLKPLI